MTAKIGRPKAERPKEIKYTVRIEKETAAKMAKYCTKKKITHAAAIRNGIELLLSTEEKKEP